MVELLGEDQRPKRTQRLPKKPLDDPKSFGRIFWWAMRQMGNSFEGFCSVPSGIKKKKKKKTAFDKQKFIRLPQLTVTSVYQRFLEENIWCSAQNSNSRVAAWAIGQDNTQKHTSKSTSEGLKRRKKNKNKVLELLSKAPHLYPTQVCWNGLNSPPPPSDLKDSLSAIAEAWLQLLSPRVAQPLIRSRGHLCFGFWAREVLNYFTLSCLCLTLKISMMNWSI